MPPPTHPQLSAAQLQELRDILETERARLTRSLERAKRDGPVQLDQQAVGRLSRMDALMNEGLAQGSMSRAREEVGLIEQALKRIENGSYGFCLTCGEPIEVGRLVAIPETLHCTGCRP
ncbi:MAG: TraR/DksA family transcriptional regulator [Gemmatimonadetes bacterium]|nr:TraR/DksA family transcriptional regulator [Gemmatimonadota bacterium]